MVPFVWVEDVGVNAIIDADDYLEMRTNLDTVKDMSCPAHDAGALIAENVGADIGEDVGENIGEDTGENIGEDTGEDTGEDVGADTGVNSGEDTSENVSADTGEDVGEDIGEDIGAQSSAQGDQTSDWGGECATHRGAHKAHVNTVHDSDHL